MTTMTENGMLQSPHELLGTQMTEEEEYRDLPEEDEAGVPGVKQSAVPLFSQHLLTVEQLRDIVVDADIQASVNDFLKGLSNQMFARIVRNGSGEVGGWLAAKVQAERDGWTAMLRMAMENIEYHRKNALRGQVLLHNTVEQLRLLVDCFQLQDEDIKKEMTTDDIVQDIHTCVKVLVDCCNALMEDRFQCIETLESLDPAPTSLASAVKGLKERLDKLGQEKASLHTQLNQAEAETSQLRQQNEQMYEEVQGMEAKVRSKQDDLEALKAQLKELEKMVRMSKKSVADKSVGTHPQPSKHVHKSHEPTQPAHAVSSTAKDHMFSLTHRQPSLIELSEEKLRVLKERAKKLEHSLHGAIASMDKLRKVAPRGGPKPNSSPSSGLNTAVFVALPTQSESSQAKTKAWMSASFQVTNTASASSTTAPVPKLGRFQPTERRCFSERPAAAASADTDAEGKALPPRGDSRRLARTRSGQVSKCLRCQKLFTATDNHKLACCYHGKGKERMEVYSDGGQLVRVHYVWKCCNQQAESDGCCYGHHV